MLRTLDSRFLRLHLNQHLKFKLNAAKAQEPRTKNQDAQDSQFLGLGSWGCI